MSLTLCGDDDCFFILRRAPDGRDAGPLVADAPEVLRGLDETVGVSRAWEARGDEGKHPLLVHQVGQGGAGGVVVFVVADGGEVRARTVEPPGSCKEQQQVSEVGHLRCGTFSRTNNSNCAFSLTTVN